jgi:hypothetical protein
VNPARAWNKMTLADHVGPFPNAAIATGLAAGAGLGAGALYDRFLAPRRSRNRPLVWAALTGGLVGIPSFVGAAQRASNPENPNMGARAAFLAPWPSKSASSFGPVDTRPQPMTFHSAASTILADPTLTPVQRLHGLVILDNAAPRGAGFSTADLIRGAAAAGLGYALGSTAGKVLAPIFGLPPQTQRILATTGAVGAVMRQAGIWR